jgi:hypothetical protein
MKIEPGRGSASERVSIGTSGAPEEGSSGTEPSRNFFGKCTFEVSGHHHAPRSDAWGELISHLSLGGSL